MTRALAIAAIIIAGACTTAMNWRFSYQLGTTVWDANIWAIFSVALDVTKGVCYGLNRIGTRIWQLIETPRSAREIADILLSEFDVPPEVCLEQTLNLLRELAAAELVRE